MLSYSTFTEMISVKVRVSATIPSRKSCVLDREVKKLCAVSVRIRIDFAIDGQCTGYNRFG
jgi:hypothetical protein